MENHFVESHLEGYYFSSQDEEFIEEYCEECGDNDRVLFTYDDEDKDEPVKSLINYFTLNKIKSKEDLERVLTGYDANKTGIGETIGTIKMDMLYDLDNNKYIIASLLEYNEISEEEYQKIINALDVSFVNQMAFLNCFDYKSLDMVKNKTRKRNKSGE